jgi:hypothetical protein
MDILEQCELILLGLEKAHAFDPSDKVAIEYVIILHADNIAAVKYNNPYDDKASRASSYRTLTKRT